MNILTLALVLSAAMLTFMSIAGFELAGEFPARRGSYRMTASVLLAGAALCFYAAAVS